MSLIDYDCEFTPTVVRPNFIKDEWELFDLQADPMEMNNLYGKTGYEEITGELRTELKRLQEQYDDPIRETIE